MYIREIVLDGFKTYQNRTTIAGFDPQFNAITGLNGSGKSNILDAIQFLLGSNCKEMLRLKSNMSELIYKDGYAGITKATVAIKFACPDRSMRPTGYEDCDELLVTRQISKDHTSKFFINGTTSTLTKVKNLFRSVSLNIDNPHFLVKQGQITKIINLKPIELLGMIEETAGTAYYNKIKQESENMMNKKKEKLAMIDQLLKNSIEPQIRKIRREREEYQAWKAGENRLKEMQNRIKWHEWVSKEQKRATLEVEILHAKNDLQTKTVERNNAEKQLKPLEIEMEDLKKQISTFNKEEVQKLRTAIATKDAERTHIIKRVEGLRNDIAVSDQTLEKDALDVESTKKKLEYEVSKVEELEREIEQGEATFKQMASNKADKGATEILQRQLSEYQTKLKSLRAELKTLSDKKAMLQSEKEGEASLEKEMEMGKQRILQQRKQLQAQIDRLKNLEPPQAVEAPEHAEGQMNSLESELNKVYNSNQALRFRYVDPQPGFARTSVKGKLFMLFRVRDKRHEKAIEVGVGGRLHNVVVDNEQTSKLLIDKGTFGYTTFIPNEKVVSKTVAREVREECAKIANQLGGQAQLACELVDHSKELEPTIKYGLGNFIVCSNTEIAKRIAFNPNRNLRIKCVTLDGDIIDPAGTLTGGFYAANNFVLGKYDEARKLQERIAEERHEIGKAKQNYEVYKRALKEYQNSRSEIEASEQRIRRIDERLNKTNNAHRQKNFEQQLADISSRVKSLQSEQSSIKQKQETLRKNLSSGTANEADILKQQKKELQREVEDKKKKLHNLKETIGKMENFIEDKKSEMHNERKSAEQSKEDVRKLTEKQRAIVEELTALRSEHQKLEEEYIRQERQTVKSAGRLALLKKEHDSLARMCDELSSQIKRAEHLSHEGQKELKELSHSLQQLEKDNPWLKEDKASEMVVGYDPATFRYDDALREHNKFKSEQEILKKGINFNVQNSNERTENYFKQLMSKQQILEKDRMTLITNISNLDEKRKQTLEKCFEQVRHNLSKIFTDLLPGAVARLRLIDSSDVTQGCELSVEFDKVKKSLNELSGGQRSLLALSFILSLLLYKPSPFYILDEIDSALDQSHTENIGFMISQRFPQSQFIIISLKQGMFSNANVLLKVSFVDGESKVERQQLRIKRN